MYLEQPGSQPLLRGTIRFNNPIHWAQLCSTPLQAGVMAGKYRLELGLTKLTQVPFGQNSRKSLETSGKTAI